MSRGFPPGRAGVPLRGRSLAQDRERGWLFILLCFCPVPRRPSACQASTSPPRSYKLQEKRGRHGSSYRKIKDTAVGAPARAEPLGPDTLGFDSPSDGADSHPSSQNLCLYRPAILYRPSDHIKACDQTGTPTPNACSLLRYENSRLQAKTPCSSSDTDF